MHAYADELKILYFELMIIFCCVFSVTDNTVKIQLGSWCY